MLADGNQAPSKDAVMEVSNGPVEVIVTLPNGSTDATNGKYASEDV